MIGAVRWLVVPWREFERWDYLSNYQQRALRCAFPITTIGEIMTVRRQLATPAELSTGNVRMLDRVSFDGEIFVGDRQQTRMDQWIAEPGDIIVSKIRARQGSIGLVEESHGKIGVSIHYRALTPDTARMDGRYAHLAMRSRYGKTQFLAATGGAMKGEISEQALLTVRLPLPAIAVQRRVVRAWETSRKAAATTAAKIVQLEEDTEGRFLAALGLKAPIQATLPKYFAVSWSAFLRWSVSHNQHAQMGADITCGKYPVVSLGECLDLVQYGTSEKANSVGRGTPVLRISNVKGRTVDTADLKHVELSDGVRQGLLLKDGDILVIRTSGSRDLVGTCAVFHEHGDYVFASYLIRLRVHPLKAHPDYLVWFLNSALGRQQVDATSRQIMQNNINSEELRALQVPLPPLAQQEAIMRQVSARCIEVATLKADAKTRAEAAKAQVEAMILGTEGCDRG